MATLLTRDTHDAYHSLAVRKIGFADLFNALSKGIDDFRAKPTHLFFLAIIYPLATLGAALVTFHYSVMPFVFPVVAGFFLLGPVVGLSLYEMSRRRERGEDLSWPQEFNFFGAPSIREIGILGVLLVAVFFLWLTAANTIYDMTLGVLQPQQIADFGSLLFSTSHGWSLIVAGNLVGLFFALTVFSISVVSFPLLLDRQVSVGTAVATSIKAVAVNPAVMAVWALIMVGSLTLGALPLLVGIAVVFPILAHTTWHLYRKIVGY